MYSAATIKRSQTILRNASKQTIAKRQQQRAPLVQSKRPSDRAAVMATKDATIGQMKRINRLHAQDGLRQYGTIAAFRAVYPTMLDASNYYAEIR